MIRVSVTEDAIELAPCLKEVVLPSHGAQVIFTGAVRNHNQGKKVLGVSYDAFQPLVKTTFETICQEACQAWGAELSISLTHRVGRLNVGELSLLIIVSSRHRDEAYKASRQIIEQIKHRAPIWKKEHYEEGDSEWLEGHALCDHSHAET